MTFAADGTGDVAPEDREELRLALVMTGGVSLAIWIGGVTAEISRMTRGVGVYQELTDLTGVQARVDVISGASAGGINGALLALAMARCQGLDVLKKLWLEKAGLVSLLRSPLEKDPPSLMRGDSYFLPELMSAFHAIDDDGCTDAHHGSEDAPIHLIMTTSLLRGSVRAYRDDFGSAITDIDHRATFTFRRGGSEHRHHQRDGVECIHEQARNSSDDFAEPGIADRLALAARCTASFPGAFEPSLCPIGHGTDDPFRPDMRCYADFTRTRFTVDGGVLVNKPIGPAIRAIYEESASRQVRRVLAYVVPDPGELRQSPQDTTSGLPSLLSTVVGSLVTLPRTESVGAEVGELRDRNQRSQAQRRNRQLWLMTGSLIQRAEELFEEYRTIRAEASVSYILLALEKGLGPERSDVPGWDPSKLRRALLPVREQYLPDSFPSSTWRPSGPTWEWGLHPVESAALAVLDVLKRGMELVIPRARTEDEPPDDPATIIRDARDRVHANLAEYRNVVQALDDRFWQDRSQGALEALQEERRRSAASPLESWAAESFAAWPIGSAGTVELRDAAVAIALDVAESLLRSEEALRALVSRTKQDARAPSSLDDLADQLERMLDALIPQGGAEARLVLRLLLALDVVQTVLGPSERVTEQGVELLQISAESPNCLGGPTKLGEKVAGTQLGHFGDFYKRSWRANDWMWGRLDAAYRLTQVLLDPRRLRQRRLPRDAVIAVIRHVALGQGALNDVLAGEGTTWNEGEIEAELEFLEDPSMPLPPQLPACTQAVARRIQLEIASEEIRDIARAIDFDLAAGAARLPEAVTFMEEVKKVPGSERLEPADALRLFGACHVGAERFKDDAGSDLFAETVGTGAAVAASVGQGKRSGFGPLRMLLSSVRGAVLAVWMMTRSAVRGSKAGAALTVSLIAIGGALVALTLLSDPPSLVVSVGAALLVAGFGVAFLRAGAVIATLVVVLGIIIATLPFLATQAIEWFGDEGEWWNDSLIWLSEHRDDLGPIFMVAGVVIGSVLLGTVRRRAR